jgi:hypothetical protein
VGDWGWVGGIYITVGLTFGADLFFGVAILGSAFFSRLVL